MENDPNQTPQSDQPQDIDIDARIAAEHYNTGQYAAYDYDESLFDRVTSAIAANKLLLIPIIAVPIILIGSLIGISASNSNKKTNQDTTALTEGQIPVEYSVETIGGGPSDDEGTLAAAGDNSEANTNDTTSNSVSTSRTTTDSTTRTTRINNQADNTQDTNTNTPVDLCVNLSGNQSTVPTGFIRDNAGGCNFSPVVIDLCSNLNGVQTKVPADHTRDSKSICTKDICPNLGNAQPALPSGYTKDKNGNCVKIPIITQPSKIDIRPWKVTLPVGSAKDPIEQAATKLYSPWYTKVAGAYVFYVDSARATARTTNSPNIRSELREMQAANPSQVATWYPKSGGGVHQMLVRLKVTKNTGKGHVVIAQIHGDKDDVTVVRLERIGNSNNAKMWFTQGDETHGYDPRITVALNQVITVGFKAENGKVHYYYDAKGSKNPRIVYTWTPRTVKGENVGKDFIGGSYFKTGNYQQSKDYSGRSETAVTIIGLGLSHNGKLPDIGGN